MGMERQRRRLPSFDLQAMGGRILGFVRPFPSGCATLDPRYILKPEGEGDRGGERAPMDGGEKFFFLGGREMTGEPDHVEIGSRGHSRVSGPKRFSRSIHIAAFPRRFSLLPRCEAKRVPRESVYLVDPASSHMLVSKIKPCKCQHMPPNG